MAPARRKAAAEKAAVQSPKAMGLRPMPTPMFVPSTTFGCREIVAESTVNIPSGPNPRMMDTIIEARTFLSRSRRRSEEHTSELQSRFDLVCRLLLEKKKQTKQIH